LLCDSPLQRTLAGEIEVTGIGVHSGQPVRLRALPAEADTGLRFRRVDLPGAPEIPATMDHILVGEMDRRTTIGLNQSVGVGTTEHLLAVCVGLGIDNAIFEVNSGEVPILDGSAAPLVDAFLQCGLTSLDRPRRFITVEQPVVYDRFPVQIIALPSPVLRVTYFVDYDNEVVLRQAGDFEITPESFARDLASARTFCFESEIEQLRAAGLIRGGDLRCAVVVGKNGILGGPLRFPDEMVRHKIVDLLGDLCLLGRPLRAHVSAWRAGHARHIEFLEVLRKTIEGD
jgi:UDP-3-O-acyl N-acetylglucosamine deacetylase